MGNDDVKKILQYPIISEVDKLLSNVSLKDNERIAIDLVDRRGVTEEKASKIMQVSKRTVQNYRNKAYDKLRIAFKNNKKANNILKTR